MHSELCDVSQVFSCGRSLKGHRSYQGACFSLSAHSGVAGLAAKKGREYSPQDGARCRAIRLLLNLERIDLSALSLVSARGIGLYGSWARGTNDQESDLDVWIKADSLPGQSILARLQRDLSIQTGSEVNLLTLTPEKLERLKIEDPPFYNSLVMDSVTLKGEGLEEYR